MLISCGEKIVSHQPDILCFRKKNQNFNEKYIKLRFLKGITNRKFTYKTGQKELEYVIFRWDDDLKMCTCFEQAISEVVQETF